MRYGLLPTLARLSSEQASQDIHGASIAGHARHAAFHMEVTLRWAAGERGPFDWQGSFLPAAVSTQQWQEVQGRLQAAYTALQQAELSNSDLAASLAHAAYHLGAVRQMMKVVGVRE